MQQHPALFDETCYIFIKQTMTEPSLQRIVDEQKTQLENYEKKLKGKCWRSLRITNHIPV